MRQAFLRNLVQSRPLRQQMLAGDYAFKIPTLFYGVKKGINYYLLSPHLLYAVRLSQTVGLQLTLEYISVYE